MVLRLGLAITDQISQNHLPAARPSRGLTPSPNLMYVGRPYLKWYSSMKSFVIIVATLLLLTAIQVTSPSFATGTEPVIRVEPSTYIASSAGETFSINVTVTDAEDVNGWQINLLFAPSLLVVSDYEFGDFMRKAREFLKKTSSKSKLIFN